MSHVGEAYRPEPGHKRPVGNFFAGAASLLGLGRLLTGGEPLSTLLPARSAVTRRMTPIFQTAAAAPVPASSSESDVSEIESLAAHIAGAGFGQRARRVLITHSGLEQEPLASLDCASFGSQLARSLADAGRTILVVFGGGGGARPGLSELVDGSASFSEAIHRETGSRLHILPSGRGRTAPGVDLNVVLEALADTYDFVVLSAADENPDVLRRLSISVAAHADHVLIACHGQTGSPDMVALRGALKDEGAGEVMAVRVGQERILSREAA